MIYNNVNVDYQSYKKYNDYTKFCIKNKQINSIIQHIKRIIPGKDNLVWNDNVEIEVGNESRVTPILLFIRNTLGGVYAVSNPSKLENWRGWSHNFDEEYSKYNKKMIFDLCNQLPKGFKDITKKHLSSLNDEQLFTQASLRNMNHLVKSCKTLELSVKKFGKKPNYSHIVNDFRICFGDNFAQELAYHLRTSNKIF